MIKHDFIFKPGTWVGEGRVTFSTSPEHIHFYTKWIISKEEQNAISCTQEVEMRGGGENVCNHFTFLDISDTSFAIQLENELLGKTIGKGVVEAKTIAWELRDHPDFEGFEVYELQDNGDYMVHAEYISPDSHRTTIDGRVWQKST